jgi:hypothetical protein
MLQFEERTWISCLALPFFATPLPLPLVTASTGAVSTAGAAVDLVATRSATRAAAEPPCMLTRTTGRDTRAQGATETALEALSVVACMLGLIIKLRR